MAEKTCIVCGRPIRTGRLYCFEHRNYRPPREVEPVAIENRPAFPSWLLIVFLVLVFVLIALSSLSSPPSTPSVTWNLTPAAYVNALPGTMSRFDQAIENNCAEDIAIFPVPSKETQESLNLSNQWVAEMKVTKIDGYCQFSVNSTENGVMTTKKYDFLLPLTKCPAGYIYIDVQDGIKKCGLP